MTFAPPDPVAFGDLPSPTSSGRHDRRNVPAALGLQYLDHGVTVERFRHHSSSLGGGTSCTTQSSEVPRPRRRTGCRLRSMSGPFLPRRHGLCRSRLRRSSTHGGRSPLCSAHSFVLLRLPVIQHHGAGHQSGRYTSKPASRRASSTAVAASTAS